MFRMLWIKICLRRNLKFNCFYFQGRSLADWALNEDGQLNLRSIIIIGK